MMDLEQNSTYESWLDTLASIRDNPFDSVNTEEDMVNIIAEKFDKDATTVRGDMAKLVLFREPLKGAWTIEY